MSDKNEKDLELTNALFSFLTGHIPEDCKIPRGHMPKLTAEQARTVIWYLGNQYWQVTDHVEPCGVCGEFYNSWNAGDCLDYGSAPYHFCDNCMTSQEYWRKLRSRLNPNKESRNEAIEAWQRNPFN